MQKLVTKAACSWIAQELFNNWLIKAGCSWHNVSAKANAKTNYKKGGTTLAQELMQELDTREFVKIQNSFAYCFRKSQAT